MPQPIIPAARLNELPAPDPARAHALLRAEVSASPLRLVVLDDDPTGTQTVHDVNVYTDWSPESMRAAFATGERMFFVLTNSRSFTAEHTALVHEQIARNVFDAARAAKQPYLILSRGDSTLRGHYPLETETLRHATEQCTGTPVDGEILCPYFREGGRFTIDNIHYVRTGDRLVPCGETEFARDETFGYRASDLREYIAEKTGGDYPAAGVCCITLTALRGFDLEGITAQLMAVRDFNKVIVNAAEDCDVQVFAAALYRAMRQGKHFLIRCAAALVKAMADIDTRPLLTRAELLGGAAGGGVIAVGSHTQKTTAQLAALRALPGIAFLELNSDLVLTPGALARETAEKTARAAELLRAGQTVCLSTCRRLLALPGDTPEAALLRSVAISDALQSCVGGLPAAPAFVVAKGGITSADVGIKALGVRCARVLGQIQPGVPVWRTGPESRFPGIPYIIFPGNVGEDQTLRRAVETLLGQAETERES